MAVMVRGRGGRVRIALWGMAALLLAAPLVAMRFTDAVRWTAADFALFAMLLAVAGAAGEGLARIAGNGAYRLGAAVTIGAAFLLVWVDLAVGIIGSEGHPANLLHGATIALLVAIGGFGRFRPAAMRNATLAAAAAQVAVAIVAVAMGWGRDAAIWPRDVIGASAVFTLLWLLAAALFRAGERRPGPDASPRPGS